MAIKNKIPRSGRIRIDITGPEGNAFCLLAYAKKYARELDLDYNKISSEMQSGDYENLIKVFDEYFGDYVDLLR